MTIAAEFEALRAAILNSESNDMSAFAGADLLAVAANRMKTCEWKASRVAKPGLAYAKHMADAAEWQRLIDAEWSRRLQEGTL